jgi:hypothetical protein
LVKCDRYVRKMAGYGDWDVIRRSYAISGLEREKKGEALISTTAPMLPPLYDVAAVLKGGSSMDKLSPHEIKMLLDQQKGVCVSLFLPTIPPARLSMCIRRPDSEMTICWMRQQPRLCCMGAQCMR